MNCLLKSCNNIGTYAIQAEGLPPINICGSHVDEVLDAAKRSEVPFTCEYLGEPEA